MRIDLKPDEAMSTQKQKIDSAVAEADVYPTNGTPLTCSALSGKSQSRLAASCWKNMDTRLRSMNKNGAAGQLRFCLAPYWAFVSQ
ncbi:MAG: hypothetical protein II697_07670 [Clostridia bacterium]|nr:hypothetical protein [Clostridia bacterium]